MAKPKLISAAPVLSATDVGKTAAWYRDTLGFRTSLFPDGPPHSFCILCRDGVELMLRHDTAPARAERDWDVYLRMEGVDSLHDELAARTAIVEPLRDKPYRCREFAIEDPDGHRIVFGEDTEGGDG